VHDWNELTPGSKAATGAFALVLFVLVLGFAIRICYAIFLLLYRILVPRAMRPLTGEPYPRAQNAGVYVLHVFLKGRPDFPTLKRKVGELAREWKVTEVYIEAAASGVKWRRDSSPFSASYNQSPNICVFSAKSSLTCGRKNKRRLPT